MKKYGYVAVLFLLCLSLLTACGKGGDVTPSNSSAPKPGATTPDPGVTDQTVSPSSDSASSLVKPWYDILNNTLMLVDLSAGSTLASYPFDTPQTLATSVVETQNGYLMLAFPMATNAITSDRVMISGDDEGNMDSIVVYRFDKQLKLKDSFTLDDPDLVDYMKYNPLAVAPDGNTITWVHEDSIYHYALDTGSTVTVPFHLPETIYMIQAKYSASGKYLFYYGDGDYEDTILYGALDPESGEATMFQAKDFIAQSIEVNGEYAVVNASVPPGKTSGSGHALIIDAQAGTGKELALNHQAENNTAVVSSDGKALMTCDAAADEKSGTLRCYDVASGTLALEQPYSFDTSGWPHEAVFHQENAYVILNTTTGPVLSSPIALP